MLAPPGINLETEKQVLGEPPELAAPLLFFIAQTDSFENETSRPSRFLGKLIASERGVRNSDKESQLRLGTGQKKTPRFARGSSVYRLCVSSGQELLCEFDLNRAFVMVEAVESGFRHIAASGLGYGHLFTH